MTQDNRPAQDYLSHLAPLRGPDPATAKDAGPPADATAQDTAASPRPEPSEPAPQPAPADAPPAPDAAPDSPPGPTQFAPPPPGPRMNPAGASPRPDSREAVARKWPIRGPLMLGVISLLILFAGFGSWAWFSRIAGAVVAHGQVELQSSRQVVQHPDGGVVDDILVTEGETVAAGDPLIRLDGTLLETELAIVEGQYYELLARRGRLEAERADAPAISFPADLVTAAGADPAVESLREGQQSLFRARADTIAQSLDQLSKQSDQVAAQIDGLGAQEDALTRQRDLLERELVDQRSLLQKGLAQAPRVLALEREAARLDGQLGEIDATRAQAETRRTEIGIESLRLTAERRETAETELRDQGYRELELAERRRGLTEQIARLEIRAPVSGVIHELQVRTPRSVIRPAEPLMYLVPQDRPLIIGARISPINVDEVHPGQQVKLVFSAFSSRTTPEIDGEVIRVSPDAVLDEATRTTYYRAEVTIPPDELPKLGSLALIPGMPVEVFIQTGERSPLNYLLKPLADYFNRAFREG